MTYFLLHVLDAPVCRFFFSGILWHLAVGAPCFSLVTFKHEGEPALATKQNRRLLVEPEFGLSAFDYCRNMTGLQGRGPTLGSTYEFLNYILHIIADKLYCI